MADNPDFSGSGPGLDIEDIFDFGRDVIDFFGGGDAPGITPGRLPAATPPASQRLPTTTGIASTQAGCPPVVVPVEIIGRAKVPRGYVVVVDPRTKQKVGMLKAVARHCKLWKPARKPPISASDWRCLQKANMTVKKLDRVVKMSNKVTGKASLTRSRRKSS